MRSPLGEPKLSDYLAEPPERGSRLLLLAPPGELAHLAKAALDAVGREGSVQCLIEGEPFLHGPLPGRLQTLDGDPRRATGVQGPYDLILARSRFPLVQDLDAWLTALTPALRPGGRLSLDLPAYGFSAPIQASHPAAADWVLHHPSEIVEALKQSGFRAQECKSEVEVWSLPSFADLVEEIAAADSIFFEGREGRERLEVLRQNLAAVFVEAGPLDLTLRRLHARAQR